MNLSFHSAKLVGPSGTRKKSQIVERNQTLLLATITMDGGVHTSALLDSALEEFNQRLTIGVDSLLSRIKSAAKQLIDQCPGLEDYLLLVIDKDVIYAAVRGDIKLYLLRQARLVRLIEGHLGVTFISGKLQPGDTIYATTGAILKNNSLGVIKAALSQADINTAAELLAPLTSKESESASLVLKIDSAESSLTSNTISTQPKRQLTALSKKIKVKVINAIDKILVILPQKKVYVGDRDISYKANRSARRAAFLGIILLLVLGLSIFFGSKKARDNARVAQFKQAVENVEKKADEAKSLQSLNPARARMLILEAQKMAQQLSVDFPDQNSQSLESEIRSQIQGIAGLYQMEPELFLDLSLVSSGMQADVITQSAGRMLVLDKYARKVVSTTISNKKTQVIGGPSDLANVGDVAAYVSRNFALTDDGVVELVNPRRKVLDKDWETAKILAYTGNMYVLDTSRRQILRFSGQDQGFGNKTEWLTTEFFPQGEVKSWAIDGSVWILADNEVYRYLSGREDYFYLQGVSSVNLDYLYTDEESESLYLLDKSNQHILVFDKKGAFIGEYQSLLLADAKGFVVSEPEQKLIFIAGSKVYSINLQHLGSN